VCPCPPYPLYYLPPLLQLFFSFLLLQLFSSRLLLLSASSASDTLIKLTYILLSLVLLTFLTVLHVFLLLTLYDLTIHLSPLQYDLQADSGPTIGLSLAPKT